MNISLDFFNIFRHAVCKLIKINKVLGKQITARRLIRNNKFYIAFEKLQSILF